MTIDWSRLHNWQDVLWAIPNSFGPHWDVFFGMLAVITAVVGFLKLIMNHPFNALLVSRVIIYGGYLLVGAMMLNSGWTKIAIGVLVSGGFFTTMLIVSGWCERKDQSETLLGALGRWLYTQLSAIFWPDRQYRVGERRHK